MRFLKSKLTILAAVNSGRSDFVNSWETNLDKGEASPMLISSMTAEPPSVTQAGNDVGRTVKI